MDSLLRRRGAFVGADFAEYADDADFFSAKEEFFEAVRVLVIGAGGLGCELLKNLALVGFRRIDVIDMDTIDPSNLNRQFLFRPSDVGMYKAEVAAQFVNARVPGARVRAHNCSIQAKDGLTLDPISKTWTFSAATPGYEPNFYEEFMDDRGAVVIMGLDAFEPRQWLNNKFCHLARVHAPASAHIIDGGTSALLGTVIYIRPGHTSCMGSGDCMPAGDASSGIKGAVPICTLASKPRSPDHCAVWAANAEPGGGGWWRRNEERMAQGLQPEELDKDNPAHIAVLVALAQQHAEKFGITGVNFRQVQGAVKGIMPAIGATNALVAATCVNEAVKLLTQCGRAQDSLQLDVDGCVDRGHQIFEYHGNGGCGAVGTCFQYTALLPSPDCRVCSSIHVAVPTMLVVPGESLADSLARLREVLHVALPHWSPQLTRQRKILLYEDFETTQYEVGYCRAHLAAAADTLLCDGDCVTVSHSSAFPAGMPASVEVVVSISSPTKRGGDTM
jgi:molybdopterin/thiamine biosynthesis adenylyltransferase